ncbi:MAG: hypothetical protein J6S67_19035 [Methanobrevibacter sp.]|nr:hypothetical protein [Methanobrevibacter sp.]
MSRIRIKNKIACAVSFFISFVPLWLFVCYKMLVVRSFLDDEYGLVGCRKMLHYSCEFEKKLYSWV